jgi:hypothetical protein
MGSGAMEVARDRGPDLASDARGARVWYQHCMVTIKSYYEREAWSEVVDSLT